LNNVEAVLEAAAARPCNVLKTTVFLQSMNDFISFNSVYSGFFGETKPARSCVEVAKLSLGALVEIE
jgi:enamine deaminase RidA (YjgF/YER057c/UK114 family)